MWETLFRVSKGRPERKRKKKEQKKEEEEEEKEGGKRARFLLSRGRVAMGKGSSDGPELGVIRLGGCLDVN